MPTLYEGAQKLVHVCANVQPNESVLIVTDDQKFDMAKVVRQVVLEELHADAALAMIGGQSAGGQEPPVAVSAAMKAVDVIIMMTSHSLSQTTARREAQKAGARVLNIPDPQLSDLTSAMITPDFVAISPYIHQVADLLTDAQEIHCTAPGGTDLTFSGKGMKGNGLDLLAHKPGEFRSMSVEANIGPAYGTANGKLVIDASLPLVGPLDAPIVATIKDGFAVKFEGGKSAEKFSSILENFHDKNCYNIAEFGIGLNPCAKATGNSYVEDESAITTCHIGFGTNLSQGGNIKAACHVDAIFRSPTITVDGKVIMKDGELVDIPLHAQI